MTVSLPACLQCPEIDSSSDEGIVPDKFDSTIEFKNVCFSYPTRPDVQASILSTCISHLGRTIISVHPECGVLTPLLRLSPSVYSVLLSHPIASGPPLLVLETVLHEMTINTNNLCGMDVVLVGGAPI